MPQILKFGLALTIGILGALIFIAMSLPLPWMLGPMTACLFAAAAGLPIVGLQQIRPVMMAVIGVLIGSNFYPDILGQMLGWLPTILGLLAYSALYAATQIAFLRWFGGCDVRTAFCAGVPGGLPEMIQMSEESGADTSMVALCHGARIFFVVLLLPQIINILAGVDLAQMTRSALSFAAIRLDDCLWLAGTGLAGILLGRVLRLPAAPMLGPMLVSATIHLAGVSDFRPASEIVVAAQLVLGTLVGCRFVGTPRRTLVRVFALSGASTLVILCVTFALAVGLSSLTGHEAVPILLAYAPGGLTEMSLVALALKLEVAFVVAHHVVRVLLVIVLAGTMMRWLERRTG